jgi:hypothetical protein
MPSVEDALLDGVYVPGEEGELVLIPCRAEPRGGAEVAAWTHDVDP